MLLKVAHCTLRYTRQDKVLNKDEVALADKGRDDRLQGIVDVNLSCSIFFNDHQVGFVLTVVLCLCCTSCREVFTYIET